MVLSLGAHAAEDGDAGTQHVHGVRVRGKLLERVPDSFRHAAQADEMDLVGGELGGSGQLAVDEKVRDFGKFAVGGEVGDVVAAVVQVVAALADGADGGFAGGGAGKRDGFFGLEGGGRVARLLNAHWIDPRRALS